MTATDSLFKISTYRSTFQSLPITVLGLGTLLLSGLFGILINAPPHQADGTPAALSRVSGAFSLIQAFYGDSVRPAPQLWNQRLGLARAANLWKLQGRSVWWQGWSEDGDAYLILPDHLLEDDSTNLRKHQVLGLSILGSDELHRQQLIQRLEQPSELPAQATSLHSRCMQRLAEAPAVFWTGDALAAISGTLAPLLQQSSHGCLALRLKGNQLHWGGVVGDRSIALAAAQPQKGWVISASNRSVTADFDQASLLEIHGARLDLMLGTLLNRQIIQEPLEDLYGVDQSIRAKLSSSPFSLRLQERTEGVYQAGLQLQVPLPGGATIWGSVLNRLSDRLEERGLRQQKIVQSNNKEQNTVIWKDVQDGKNRIVGGWRWLQQENKPDLLSAGLAMLPDQNRFDKQLPESEPSVLLLHARPKTLSSMELMNGSWPLLLKKANSMSVQIKPAVAFSESKARGKQTWWEVSGQLVVASEAEGSEDSE